MYCVSRNDCEIILEVSTLTLAETSGRGLKEVFGDLRKKKKKEESLDDCPYKSFREPSLLTCCKKQKTLSELRTLRLV